MGINSPMPVRLQDETRKAAKIMRSFVDDHNNGIDKVIPQSVMQRAAGFAIFTVIKAGFVLSARAGSGVVIARTPQGDWSPPSAIGLGGFGFGGQAGAEVTDFLIVLNSTAAVKSFMAAGSLTLGGNLSIAVGPLGRNAEGTGAVNTKGKMAAMYSYSRTKGLFGGLSVEGSIIVERQDANRLAYGGSPSAKQILSGTFDAPDWAQVLVDEINRCTGLPGGRRWRSWEDEGEFGEMGSFHPDDYVPGHGKKKGGAGGYAFGEGLGAGGAGTHAMQGQGPGPGEGYSSHGYEERQREADKEKGRKRGSSLSIFDRQGQAPSSASGQSSMGFPSRLGGSSTPPRPSLSKRTSSFNPFSSKDKDKGDSASGLASPSSPTIRRGHGKNSDSVSSAGMASSENYNAGLTWDSDGPSSPWATRPRAGSSGLRPAHWDRDREASGLAQRERGPLGGLSGRERSYSDPKLSRTARGGVTGAGPGAGANLLDDDEPYGSQAEGGVDELGDRVSQMALGNGAGNRIRADSVPSRLGGTGTGTGIGASSGLGVGAGIGMGNGHGIVNRSRANSRLADSYVPDRNGSGDLVPAGPGPGMGAGSPSRGVYARTGSHERDRERDPFGNSAAGSTASLHNSTRNGGGTGFGASAGGSGGYGSGSGTSTPPYASASASASGSTDLGLGPASTGYARAVALFDLPASQPGDLPLKKGQVVYAMDKVGAGEWWRGMNTSGTAGIFPANYVEVLEIPKTLKGGLSKGDLRKRVPELEF